jgi:hypothetical protein
MANFSNAKANLVGTTPVTLVDAQVATVISGCSVANRHASTTSVSLYVENNSEIYFENREKEIADLYMETKTDKFLYYGNVLRVK